MEISWSYRGIAWLPFIALEAFSHSRPIFAEFSWDLHGPTKNKISGIVRGTLWNTVARQR